MLTTALGIQDLTPQCIVPTSLAEIESIYRGYQVWLSKEPKETANPPDLIARSFGMLCRGRGLDEFRIVDRNIHLHIADLNGEDASGTGERPAIRNLYAARVAIVGVIDLRGKTSQRGFAEAHEPNQQAGLLVEIQTDGRLAFALADDDIRIVIADFLRSPHLEFAEHRL